MASQAGSYAALLVGGVLAAAGFSGNSVRDILAGKGSSLKPIFGAGGAPSAAVPPTSPSRKEAEVGHEASHAHPILPWNSAKPA